MSTGLQASSVSVDNFFKDYLEAVPNASGDVEEIKAVALTLARSGKAAATLSVRVVGGNLMWVLGGGDASLSGMGDCDKGGVASFSGNPSQGSLLGGTYELTIDETTCTLILSSNGAPVHTFKGTGLSRGLDTDKGKPWKGTWF